MRVGWSGIDHTRPPSSGLHRQKRVCVFSGFSLRLPRWQQNHSVAALIFKDLSHPKYLLLSATLTRVCVWVSVCECEREREKLQRQVTDLSVYLCMIATVGRMSAYMCAQNWYYVVCCGVCVCVWQIRDKSAVTASNSSLTHGSEHAAARHVCSLCPLDLSQCYHLESSLLPTSAERDRLHRKLARK